MRNRAPNSDLSRVSVGAHALRQRLPSVLATGDWQVPGMPPSGVLVVRRLSDPLPGRVLPARHALHLGRDWEHALHGRLGDAYRKAARPAREGVSASAPAVFFSSEAEMLACLAYDLCRRAAAACWWWQAILHALPPGRTADRLARLLVDKAAQAPAAFRVLNEQGRLRPVLAKLPPASCHKVQRALCAAYAISAPAWREGPAAPAPAGGIQPPGPAVLRALPDLHMLHREQRLLAAVARTLGYRPALLRAPDYCEGLRAWAEGKRHGGSAGHTAEATGPEAAVPSKSLLPSAPPPASGRARHASEAESAHGKPSESDTAPGGSTAIQDGGERHTEERKAAPTASGVARGPAPVRPPAAERSGRASKVPPPAGRPLRDPDGAAGDSPPVAPETTAHDVAEGTPTRLCGAWYLVNVMEQLGLPDCFDATWQLARTAGAWNTLEALTRGLLGAQHREMTDDALWHDLAALDRRAPGEKAGAALEVRHHFRLPDDWLGPERVPAPRQVQWTLADERLWVWGAEGTLIAVCEDVQAAPVQHVRTLLARYGFPPAQCSVVRKPPDAVPETTLPADAGNYLSPALARWTASVLPYVRQRLAYALDVERDAPHLLAERLLLCPGRLYVSSSHVDVVMPLESASLPVRRAGLDADPGWQPTFGRVILFHFQ